MLALFLLVLNSKRADTSEPTFVYPVPNINLVIEFVSTRPIRAYLRDFF
jgi:hypothetical protein